MADRPVVSIEYCQECLYLPVALKETEALLTEFEERIGRFVLIPGSDGFFEVAVNGELVFSRYRLDRFPEAGELVKKVGARLDALAT
jgi:selenoprotein W-related protein